MAHEGTFVPDMDDLFDEGKDDKVKNDEATNNKVSNALTQSFNNPAYEANYRLEDNLSEGVNFQAAGDPALREIIQSGNASKADEVANPELMKIQLDLADKADQAAKKKLKGMISMALVGAKGWDGVKETGLEKLAASKHIKEGPDGSLWVFSSSKSEWVQITQEKTKGKFFAESSLKGKLGESSARYISNLNRTPDPPPGSTGPVPGQSDQRSQDFSQPDSASSTVLPAQAEFHDLQSEDFSQSGQRPRDNSRSTRLLADRTPNINRIFNDSSTQTPKQVINDLIDVPEEELRAAGFTDHAISEC